MHTQTQHMFKRRNTHSCVSSHPNSSLSLQVQSSGKEAPLLKNICILPPHQHFPWIFSCSPSHLRPHHGPLGPGAVPELHDRLNHCAADVAAGENLPGLKHGAIGGKRGQGDGGKPAWFLQDCLQCVHLSILLVGLRLQLFQRGQKACDCHSQMSRFAKDQRVWDVCLFPVIFFECGPKYFWQGPKDNPQQRWEGE